jgi:23S rRNA (pseudouridine1915-N3)-methyltransferase
LNTFIFTIGKPKLAYARAGVDEYLSRMGQWGGVRWEQLKSGTREQESAALLARSEGLFRVVLDERGALVTSKALAQKFSDWELRSVKGVAFLIGGSDGHTEELRKKADWLWSLTPLTLQHELALVVLCEQLYRARSILSGGPYHRE